MIAAISAVSPPDGRDQEQAIAQQDHESFTVGLGGIELHAGKEG